MRRRGCQLSINVVPFCLLILYLVHPALIENKPLMIRAFKFDMENKGRQKTTELVTSSKSHLAHNTNVRTSREEEKAGSAFELYCFLLSPYYLFGVSQTFHEPSLICLSWHGETTETQAKSKRFT